MLRIELQEINNTMTMRMEGRFVGSFAEDAKGLVSRCDLPSRLVVDLSEVSFVDAVGEEVLSWLGRIGGKFIADNAYALDVCERLHLSLARKRAKSPPGQCGGVRGGRS
jgi:hypothetical protein